MELKNKKARVFSAKYSPAHKERIRPFSGVSTQQHKKQQIMENVYNSQAFPNPRVASAKTYNGPRYSVAFQEGEKFMPRNSSKQVKQKEEMAEQILVLKQTINKLTEELSHQRGKVETIKRKNSKYSKVLTMEFENEKQWGSHAVSNHLVSGIKAMYDNLKQKYEKKCKFCDELIAKVEVTNFLEMHFYTETLEKNNKTLNKKLESIISSSLQFPVSTDAEKKAKTYHVAELKFENDTLKERAQNLEKVLKEKNLISSDQDKKMSFLQKLMIEKDNNIHAFQRKIKELSSQIKRLKQDVARINEKYNEKSSQYDKDMVESAFKYNEAQQKYKQDIEELTEMKDYKIQSLEKNLNQYQQIIMGLRTNIAQLNSQLQHLKEDRLKETFKKRQLEKSSLRKSSTLIIQSIMKKSQSNDVLSFPIKEEGPRQAQRADKRYNEEAMKKRKVELLQIIEIAELIRYRMIAKKISSEDFKNLFNKNEQRSYLDPQWSEQYIDMQEAMEIFSNEPINLGEEQALLMSRYIIEDVNQQYVYCDFYNENHREVVKSIIKTLIQHYPVFEGQKINDDFNKAIENYGENLKNSLNTLYSSGTVPKHKFLIILKSLGVEIPQDLKQFMIGKMALRASEINELPYQALF